MVIEFEWYMISSETSKYWSFNIHVDELWQLHDSSTLFLDCFLICSNAKETPDHIVWGDYVKSSHISIFKLLIHPLCLAWEVACEHYFDFE